MREQKKNFRFYWKLFYSTLLISAFTFGGGFVIIPLLKNKFVDELNWVEEDEMMRLVVIAQSSPGPIAVNASVLIGYRLAGALGAIITILGTVLPPFVIISIISTCYTLFRESAAVAAVLGGMRAGVAAVITDVALGLGAKAVSGKNWVNAIVMVLAFVAVYFFNINVVLIILFAGAVGAIVTLCKKKKEVA